MKPKRVAITGASGQVGSTLVRHLHAGGWRVIAAVRNRLGAALCHAAVPDCDIRVGRLTPKRGEAHLLDDCDVIVNCALESAAGIPRQAYTRNRALVDGLLQAKSVRWLIHFSTVAAYGELIKPYEDEERERRWPHPDSEYGRSKLWVEHYAARRAGAHGVKCTVIRLGHVYGAGIARSREIVEFSRDPRFRLPFDGRLPSNAVHADSVGAAVLGLLGSDAPRDIYSLAEPRNTWRDVFDWHTCCLGLPAVAAMSDAESKAQRDAWASRSLRREVMVWVRGLPARSLVRSPAVFDLALRILAKTPLAVTERASTINRRMSGRVQIARAERAEREPLPPLYFSAGMPGPFLDLPPARPAGLGSDAQRSREFREWCEGWMKPRVRLESARVHRELRSWV
jgi:nucleoside-diphosphate-sugar epimerase